MNQPTPTETLIIATSHNTTLKMFNKQQTLCKAKSSQRVYVLLLPLAISLMGDDRGLLPRYLLAILDVDSMRRLCTQPPALQVIDRFVFIYICPHLLNAQHNIAVVIETA